MKWLHLPDDIGLLLDRVSLMVSFWFKIPDRAERLSFLKKIRLETRAILKEARKKEKWLATYEGRPARTDKEIVRDCIKDIKSRGA